MEQRDIIILIGCSIALASLLVVICLIYFCCCRRKSPEKYTKEKQKPASPARKKRVAQWNHSRSDTCYVPIPSDELDLHGYSVKDAKAELEDFLSNAQGHHSSVSVVTGRGNNSPNGFPAIKNMVQKYLNASAYRHEWQNKGGQVRIYL